MKKLKEKQETPEEPQGPGDYYEVIAQYSTWYVSAGTAAYLGRMLDRRWRPRFVKFVDLSGSRAWVRTDSIECVAESTAGQRERDREFGYLRNKEERADRRWDADYD